MAQATRPVNWSPRLRLTAAASVVIAVALAAASVGTVIALRDSLLTSVDSAVSDDAHDVAVLMAQARMPRSIEPPTPDAAVQVVDETGTVIASSRNAPSVPLLSTPGRRPARIVVTGRLPLANTADAYHVAALRTVRGRLTVYVALPSDDVADAVDQLIVVLATGAPILLILLVVLAWTVVGRALAPMHALHRRQQQFVSDAAHELRTPLSGLLARLELAEGEDVAELRAALPRLRTEVARMASLVDGLLALARAGNALPAYADVDLDDVVLQCVHRLRERTSLAVNSSEVRAVRVRGDRSGLGRVVDNLLDNAARHASSTIDVILCTDRQSGVLTVADDGPGIPAGDRDRVFGRFTRLDSARTHTDGGVGLGLAIVRAVTDAHGGEVSVQDNAPGARFVVRIPFSRPRHGG